MTSWQWSSISRQSFVSSSVAETEGQRRCGSGSARDIRHWWYDRTQRDQGKNQLYGQQLECANEKALELAPIDDEKHVNMRRAELGLIRVELYARLVRLNLPDFCRPVGSQK